MFQMMGVFAEFERAIIQERVKAGLSRAKAQGKTLGRPKVAGILSEVKFSSALWQRAVSGEPGMRLQGGFRNVS